ncbi:MAG: ABC transporter permease [Oligoflexia bacterium]
MKILNCRRLAILWLLIWYGAALASRVFSWSPNSGPGSDPEFQLSRGLLPGYDLFGRELLSLTLQASLRSTAFAVAAVATACGAALVIAATVSTLPRRWLWLGESPLEFFVAFPSLLFALAIGAWNGPGSSTLFWALLLGTAPSLSRVLLARSRELSSGQFVQAARALGASRLRVVTRHLIPHLIPIVSVKLPALLIHALLTEASLSFIGLGFSIGTESWGTLLSQARDTLLEAPEISLKVGLPLLLCVWSLEQVSNAAVPKPGHPELR